MIVLDASVLIAHFEPGDVHHARATRLLTDLSDDPFATSPLTLAELLVGPARVGRLAQAQAAVDLLGVVTVALSADAPARLAGLRVSTNLKLPDCCVLLAAQTSGAGVATFDQGVAAAANSLGLAVSS